VALPRDRCFNVDVHYRTSQGWPLTRPLSRRSQKRAASFYGVDQPLDGHWTRASSDPRAPTLEIDYTAVVGSLTVRDYPANVGPLYEPRWPNNLERPASPDIVRFDRRVAELKAGACPRGGSAQ